MRTLEGDVIAVTEQPRFQPHHAFREFQSGQLHGVVQAADGEELGRAAVELGAEHLQGGNNLGRGAVQDRKSTRLNSSHQIISYAVFCFKKKKTTPTLSAE